MSKARNLLALMVAAVLTASCGVQFKAAEQPKGGQLKSDVGNGGSSASGSGSGSGSAY